MKGSVGTPMIIVNATDKRKKFKKGKRGTYFCTRCREYVRKGEWVKPLPGRLYRHFYPCPKKDGYNANLEVC